MRKKAFFALISGRVQGVGFRWYAQNTARRRGIAGWVRNTDDGGVEVYAEGGENDVNAFLADISRGPPSAEVDSVDTTWSAPQNKLRGFSVR